MFGLFKKKKEKKPTLTDLDNNLLEEGDHVIALRYDLGECILELEDAGFIYRSIESDKTVSWLKMIDASTDNQKVRKIV